MAIASLLATALLAQTSSFQPSVQAWTFNRFSTEDAISMAAQAGSANIELYPGQVLSKETPEVRVGPDMGAENTEKLKGFLTKNNVKAIAFGVTGISRNPDDARKLFSWAKGMGIQVINTESTDAIDTIEAMVKEFDLKVGFHNHPRQANNPNYKVWDPKYVFELVEKRDKRIGACADTGHWVRSGIKPVDAIKALKGRIVSSHLKDLHEFAPSGHDMPYGLGVSEIVAVLHEFRKIKMTGPVSVEYEHNWDKNLAEVGQCIGFLRAYQAQNR